MKNKIVTFGFDDCEMHDRRLCELFRKYGMKATFFLITDELGISCPFERYGEKIVVERVSEEEIPVTYQGMEVATHTAAHSCPIDGLDGAVFDSAKRLSALCGYEVCGMAYPGGHYTQEHVKRLKEKGLLYARTTEVTHNFALPGELLAWHPTCKYDDAETEYLVEQFLQYEGEEPILLYIYGHSYELTQKEEGHDWAYWEKILKKLSGREDIWYATNAEIAKWKSKY